MRALVIAASAALLCAACNTTAPATGTATDASGASAGAKVDAKIAEVSQTLAKQCTILALAIAAGEAWASNPKVDRVLVAAEAARQSFCAAPPKDTATAIQAVADMAIAVNSALAEAK